MSQGRASRLRLAGAGVLVTTFLVGGLGGAALERVRTARSAADVVEPPAPVEGRSGERRGDRGGRSDRNGDWQTDFWRRSDYGKLGLDSAQIEQINAVLIRQREQMDAYWKATRPAMDSIVEQTRAGMRAILTPAQQTELDRIRAERRERWRRENADRDSTSGRPQSQHEHDKPERKGHP